MTPVRLTLPVAVVAAATITGCGSGGATDHRATQPTAQSVQALRGAVSGPVALSPVFADGSGRSIALAVMKQRQSPAVPQVLLYHWDGHRWETAATIVLDVGGSVAADNGVPTPIATVDLTPATAPELLVTVHYNAGPATAVLSNYGGHWHALTFSGGLTRPGDERFDVLVNANALISRENNCVPNCAQGHLVTTVFRFDAATGRLVGGTSR